MVGMSGGSGVAYGYGLLTGFGTVGTAVANSKSIGRTSIVLVGVASEGVGVFCVSVGCAVEQETVNVKRINNAVYAKDWRETIDRLYPTIEYSYLPRTS